MRPFVSWALLTLSLSAGMFLSAFAPGCATAVPVSSSHDPEAPFYHQPSATSAPNDEEAEDADQGGLSSLLGSFTFITAVFEEEETTPVASEVHTPSANPTIQPGDWTQWGGNSLRNNTPIAKDVPLDWNVGSFDRKTGEWIKDKAKNIKWVVQLGSQTYGNTVVADGKVFIGTNNGAGYLERYPNSIDLGCLLAFDEKTGEFLWQHSSEKLPTGRVHDWPLMGICCSVAVEGKRGWYVTSRGEIICFDTEGFRDGVNNGPYKDEPNENKDEADVIWKVDMMKELGTSQHNMCSCSVTLWGDLLFVNTSNGVDESHINIPAPNAPSFLCLNKNTGEVYWTDNSPGINIHHGQWSSPAVGYLGGEAQVLFAGGDGWLYSFKADTGKDGKGELLWKFDANPKDSELILGGRGTRNDLIGTPVIWEDKVYIATGQDPEHGEGVGIFWCLDASKRGDVSPTRVVDAATGAEIPYNRIKALEPDKGQKEVENPNSAVIWMFDKYDRNGDGKYDFDEQMHRSIGTCAITKTEDGDELLFQADFSGVFHCIDAKTGQVYWAYDMLAATWGSPLIADGHVFIGDEDGDVAIFEVSKEPQEPLAEINMGSAVYSTPIFANGVLYIANKDHLFAIEKGAKP